MQHIICFAKIIIHFLLKRHKKLICINIRPFFFNLIVSIYGGYHEMPQKACERYISHVMAYARKFGENRAFQNFRTYKNGAIQKIYTWWDLERKIVRNWNYPNVRGISKFSSICHHVKNISFTCFLGHFMIPPVFQYDCWFLFNRIPFR